MKSATALKVTLLGSEWSSSMGGLSTINRQLAIQLAKHSEVEVTFLVPQFACSEEEKRMASRHNISIQEAEKRPGYSDPLEWLGFAPRYLDIDFVLGHGAKLGKQAQVIRISHRCKWIQVVHTAPEELGLYKNFSTIFKGKRKNSTEVEFCRLADAVLAVGPKVTDAIFAQLRSFKSEDDILQLTPGTFREFSDVEQAPKESYKFRVLTFGRGDPEDFSLKGYDISARAIVELKDRSYCLVFVGASNGRQDEVAANLLSSGIDKSQLIVKKFLHSKERLKELFCEVDLCIMPSITEGFGLTALEALSAGLPILVSGKSGLGKALCTVPSGKSFVVESEDPREWAKAIAGIRQMKRSVRLQYIQQLRISYEEKFSWEKQCDNLVEKMRDMIHGSLGQIIQKLQQMQLDASKVKSRTDLSLSLRNIASDRGFRISDNEGLGNGMFYALSEQLEIVKGIKIPHAELRQHLVQYLRENPKLPDGTDLFHFVHGHQTWTEYLVYMEQDGAWGDHVILSAAANLFGTCIRVISSQSKRNDVIITPHFPVDKSKPLVLGHIHEVHYVSLQPVQAPVGENKDEVPPEIRARGPQALEAYSNALVEGQACVKRVPLMIVGQDRSGKTSVKNSLKGICFNPDEGSTRGIEVDRYDFKVTTEIWKTGEKDEEANIDATVISYEYNTARWMAGKLKTHEKIAEVKKTSSAEPAGYDFEEIDSTKERDPSETLSDATPQESFINPVSTNATDLEPNLSTKGVRNPTELELEEDSLTTTLEKLPDFDDVAKVLSQFFRENREDDQEDVYSILWDFAGQSVYYVTHPLFLTRRAIYFLVYDLSRNPCFKATPLKKKGVYKPFTKDEYNLKTNFDYLDFWMSSLASLVSDCPLVSLKKFPAVFLVCTHADQPYCDRNPFELAHEIFGDLKSKPYGAHLFDVFCVDNTKSGTESECKEIMRLRAKVHVVSKELPHVIEPIPIKWLKYEKALRALKESDHKFISLSTAKKIAAKFCNINDHEVQTVLTFLHDLRVLIHFDDSPELNELVFLDIQWLIDVFKNVITVRAYDVERDFAPLWEDLEKKGILKESLLKHVWNSLVPQRETHESLIAIMEKFSLMCPWPSSDDLCNKHYLVPSMLRPFPSEKISNLVDSAQLPSLFLKFDTGRVPPGLFPRLVLEFFQWCRKEFPDVRLPKPYRNFARFNIFPSTGLSLVLLCHSSTIEVVVLSVKSAIDVVDVESIRAFRNQLTSIIDRVRKKFFWVKNVGCKVSFLCPVCSYGRVVSLCPQHHGESCKQEECLHFISESDLGDEKQAVCTNSDAVLDNRIHAEQFAPWISSGKEKELATRQRGEGPGLGKGVSDGYHRKSLVLPSEAVATLQLQRPSVGGEGDMLLVPSAQGNPGYCQVQPLVAEQFEGEFKQLKDAVNESKGTVVPVSKGYGERSLALPHDVSQSLKSKSVPARDIVCKLLNLSSLEAPAPDDTKWIRCLMRDAKYYDRTDVVNFLRENAPAGTTGPRLEESLSVMEIPSRRRTDLAVRLCGGEEWKIVADRLGFEDAYIRCFDNRFKNPVELILNFSGLNVGELYDVLVECEFPLLADLL